MGYPTLVLGLALFISCAPAQANVCGSSLSRYLVPDYICFDAQGGRVPYANCGTGRSGGTLVRQRVDFSAACATHDSCYRTKDARKSDCDAGFYQKLRAACRSQLGRADPEKLFRACIDTTLLFNDVVRGQATKRVLIWMIQPVLFTGQTGCEAYIAAQKSAGAKRPSC